MSMPNINALSESSAGQRAPAPSIGGAAPAIRAVMQKSEAGDIAAGNKPNAAELQKAVATLNKFVGPIAKSVNFQVDESTGKTVIRVMDTEKDVLISQFPSEELLSITRSIDRLQGLLIKDTA